MLRFAQAHARSGLHAIFCARAQANANDMQANRARPSAVRGCDSKTEGELCNLVSVGKGPRPLYFPCPAPESSVRGGDIS